MYQDSSETCRFSEGFDNNRSRLYFIRRVFMLLVMAVLLMIAQILFVFLHEPTRGYFREYYWLSFIGATVFVATCVILSCSNVARSIFPWNFILLLVLIESLTLILVIISSFYGVMVILLTLMCQAAVLFLLLTLATTVPVDFTKWTALFLVAFLILFAFAITTIISIYTIQLALMDILYSMIAVTILSGAILLNLQLLFNGEIFELYPDDFILGAILMYADVIIFFMCCLKMIGFDTDEC